MKSTGWEGHRNERRLIYIKKDLRKPKKKCQQRNKIPIGSRKRQNHHAENQISDVENILEKLSKNAEEKDTENFKENNKENENRYPREKSGTRVGGGGGESKWDKNANKAQ